MDERIARLRAHQKNIERYQNLLKTELTEFEMHYLEKLLSEERFVMGILNAGGPGLDRLAWPGGPT
jgi:hypothetical protein